MRTQFGFYYIMGDSAQAVWTTLLDHLLTQPEHYVHPRGVGTREILGVTLRVNDLRQNIIHHPVRNINYRFMVAEWLWMTFGRGDLAALAPYNGQVSRFTDDGLTLAGAYGPRLTTQWDYVLHTLRRDPASRQAVATIWTPNPAPSKDIPCTVAFQFLIRDGRLNLIATMRSSDVWLGVPYDIYAFTQLAGCLAGELGVDTGFFQLNIGSSHLYDDDVAKARHTLDTPALTGLGSPALPGWPPIILEDILTGSDAVSPALAPVWVSYARVLRASTWREARNVLYGMT